jgi:hypothetical protein
MATATQTYIKTSTGSGAVPSDVQALVTAYNRLEARFEALLAKLDADAFGDTDYAAVINGTTTSALITLSAIE